MSDQTDKGAKTPPAAKSSAGRGTGRSAQGTGLDSPMARLAIALAAGLLLGIALGALIFGGDDDGDEGLVSAPPDASTQVVTPPELAREARALGRPVYWAGPSETDTIELERSPEGNVSVRYIPEDADADGEAADFLTVVTYPYPEARKALEQQAASGDLLSRKLPETGFVISRPDQPTNAYLAYAGEDYQVEIYDPRPGRALQLVLEGSIAPAG